MKNLTLYLTSAVMAALFAAGCATMPAINKVSVSAGPTDGTVTYWLPKTQLTVALPVKTVVIAKSALAPKSNKEREEYLGLLSELEIPPEDMAFDDQVLSSVVAKDVTLASRAVRDPDAYFQTDLSAGIWQELSLSMEFTDDQFMASADADVTNQGFAVGLNVVKNLANALLLFPVKQPQTSAGTQQETEANGSELTVSTAFDWKKETCCTISRIKERQAKIKAFYARPQPNLEAAQIKLAVEKLQSEVDALRFRLTGGEAKSTTTVVPLTATPARDTKMVTLGCVDELTGFQPTADGSSKDAPKTRDQDAQEAEKPDTLKPSEQTKNERKVSEWDTELVSSSAVWHARSPKITPVILSLTTVAPVVEAKDALLGSKGSFVYRVPAKVRVKVGTASEVWVDKEMTLAHWGQLRQLPRSLGGIHGAYTLTLDGQTGALVKLTAKSKSADLNEPINAAAGLVKARQEAKKAAQDAADAAAVAPDPQLVKKRADLDNQQAIQELEAKLKLTNPAGTQN